MIPQLSLGSNKSNKTDQKIYLAKEFQHSLAPILSWNQRIILPNLLDLLGMHLIFIRENELNNLTGDKKQSRDLDGLQTHDPVPKLDHNLKLRGPPATNSRLFLITFPFFLGGDFHRWRNMDQPSKRRNITVFTGEKKPGPFPRAGFPITKDLMIEDNKKITGISGCTLSISFWIDPGESWRKNDRDTPRWNSVHSSKLTYIGAVFTEPFATRAPLSTVRFPKNDDQECLCSQSPCKNAHANWQSSLKGLLLPSQWITFLIKGPSQCFW